MKTDIYTGAGDHQYRWVEDWARIPDTPTGRVNGRTHGVVVTGDNHIIVLHQASPAVLIYDQEGRLVDSWGERYLGGHGLTLVREAEVEYLWLTDHISGEVVKTTLGGDVLMHIERPADPVYSAGVSGGGVTFSPTWVAINEERWGGNGDIWVADGYGANRIHRYDKTGRFLLTITGEEGEAGAFIRPHGIWFDTRTSAPELYIADRTNRRIQVYDAEGVYKRVFGSDHLTSPCGVITHGELAFVPELRARVAVLDAADQLICYLGENESVCDLPGWPDHRGEIVRPGRFNSPHAVAADSAGNLYVVEWMTGGRITKLEK